MSLAILAISCGVRTEGSTASFPRNSLTRLPISQNSDTRQKWGGFATAPTK